MSFRGSTRIFLRSYATRRNSKSGKSTDKVVGKYTKTVFLPHTKFPMWLNADRRVLLDQELLKTAGFSELYSWQRENLNGKEYVLHDGPPYANGFPHMGHAVNKILKDIVIRNRVLRGQRVHYVPGWDCHGLPIELKATQGVLVKKLSPLEIRQRAREYATRTIQDQRSIFKNWGVMAEWNDSGCYHTFDKSYVKNEIQQFWNMYQKGLLYRDLKPVYWSPSSRTALAEAELEYNEEHRSNAVTVRFKVTKSNIPKPSSGDLFLLIWTTTPWTLPGNVAVAVNPEITYCSVSDGKDNYVVAKDLLESLVSKTSRNLTILSEFKGSDLISSQYINVLEEECPVVPGVHVTSTSGTGLVHTAPAHGHDDFLLACQFDLPLKCIVDEAGIFTGEAKDLVGMNALDNKAILNKIQNDIIHRETFIHSYPYDWRTKKPVIIRACQQWFIDTEKLKSSALNALNNVEIVPSGIAGLKSKLDSRPYWCISRQRVWGVPIPVLYDIEGKTVINKDLIDRYCKLIDEHGTDFWWSLDSNEITQREDLVLGKDILDIWFDSGLTWSHILGETTADLYIEGRDQITGWFQSSLLTAIALKNRAPYKKILIHGFTVDEAGRKMSKSLGNVIDPQDLISGSGGGRGKPYGLDIIRWWVGEHAVGSQRANITLSPTSLSDSSDSIFKLRNTCKFLLGSINDFLPIEEMPNMNLVDHYVLHMALDLLDQCEEYYENFQFNKVCSSVKNFVTNHVSSFYCHLTKDRLYCEEEKADGRLAAQFTMYHLLLILNKIIAPVVPVLAEEINVHMGKKVPFFYQSNDFLKRESLAAKMKIVPVIEQALAVKASFLKSIPINTTSLELDIDILANESIYKILKLMHKKDEVTSQLTELFQVSSVNLVRDDHVNCFSTKISLTKLHLCERCRRFSSNEEDALCQRCSSVIQSKNVMTN